MNTSKPISRRRWLKTGLAAGVSVLAGASLVHTWRRYNQKIPIAVMKAASYEVSLDRILESGLREAGISSEAVKGKRILLKPNLVEVDRSAPHVNTHPVLVRAAVDVFYRLGAASVAVGEASGHCMDSIYVFDGSGLRDALKGSGARFMDLNYQEPLLVENSQRFSRLPHLAFPRVFQDVDWIVSMPKMKTHHWAGVTLSMKNLFGTMPGCYYGWPKNVLHHAGLSEAIADIALTLRPQLAIVDGIIGMEGDGPIMGDPVPSGVIVIGSDLPAVDATCARLMHVSPEQVPHLQMAERAGCSISESGIVQVGETIAKVRRAFRLLPEIPAQRNLRSVEA